MLDLGCGSGVLSLAALRLFGSEIEVLAVDIDPEATATAQENAEINGLSQHIRFITGTLDHPELTGSFDLVIANIRPRVHIPQAEALHARMRPNARATLSGILEEELAAVQDAYQRVGWELDTEFAGGIRKLETWAGLDLRVP